MNFIWFLTGAFVAELIGFSTIMHYVGYAMLVLIVLFVLLLLMSFFFGRGMAKGKEF